MVIDQPDNYIAHRPRYKTWIAPVRFVKATAITGARMQWRYINSRLAPRYVAPFGPRTRGESNQMARRFRVGRVAVSPSPSPRLAVRKWRRASVIDEDARCRRLRRTSARQSKKTNENESTSEFLRSVNISRSSISMSFSPPGLPSNKTVNYAYVIRKKIFGRRKYGTAAKTSRKITYTRTINQSGNAFFVSFRFRPGDNGFQWIWRERFN